MPVLTGIHDKTTKVFLPSYQDTDDPAWVEIYDDLSVVDLAAFITTIGDDRPRRMMELVCKVIKDWNFTNAEGKKLPVAVEYVSMLKASDMGEIINKVEEIVVKFAAAKKNTTLMEKPTA